MADHHSQTGSGQPLRNQGESPLADSQAAGSAKKSLKPKDVFADDPENSSDENALENEEGSPSERPPRPWQTERFRTISAITTICVLLGVFGFICFQKYQKRSLKQDEVASSEGTANSEKTAEVSTVPEPLADLSTPPQSDPEAQKTATPTPLGDEFAETAAVPEKPIQDEGTPGESAPAGDPGNKTAQSSNDDPFGTEGDTLAKPAPLPNVNQPPQGLTTLENITADEPATLGDPQSEDEAKGSKPETPTSSPASNSTVSNPAAPPDVAHAPPSPARMAEGIEEEIDERMAGFREVETGSNQATGSTKVLSGKPGPPSARSVSSEKTFEEELPSQDVFVPPEPVRTQPVPARGKKPLDTPKFREDPTPVTEEFPEAKPLPQELPAQSFNHAPEGSLEGEIYIVQPRDTYWKISKRHYGTVRYFLALARYNFDRVPEPRLMRPGTKIKIPTAQTLESQFPELLQQKGAQTEGQKEENGPRFFTDETGAPKYRVGPKDNLSVISERYLGNPSRWDEIYQLNQDLIKDANRLKVGTVLALPAEAGKQRMAHEPVEIR